MGFAYRMRMCIRRGVVRNWEEAKAGYWESCLKGSGALRASVGRGLRCEFASALGLEVVVLLWDCSHYYDSLR